MFLNRKLFLSGKEQWAGTVFLKKECWIKLINSVYSFRCTESKEEENSNRKWKQILENSRTGWDSDCTVTDTEKKKKENCREQAWSALTWASWSVYSVQIEIQVTASLCRQFLTMTIAYDHRLQKVYVNDLILTLGSHVWNGEGLFILTLDLNSYILRNSLLFWNGVRKKPKYNTFLKRI